MTGHTPFSKDNQPKRKKSGKLPAREKRGVMKSAVILKYAREGAEGSDIALALGLAARLQADGVLRQKFEELVSLGHAEHRLFTARRLYDQGVRKGRASALLTVAKAWLARYGDDAVSPEEEQGIVDRTEARIEALAKARIEDL